ncbi:hypothetical protein BH11CYA1_BH11CYA1_12050 [soil metagenome]
MALRNSRKKIVCALLATSFTIQSNLVCLAAPALIDTAEAKDFLTEPAEAKALGQSKTEILTAEEVAIETATDPVEAELIQPLNKAEAFAVGETGLTSQAIDTDASNTKEAETNNFTFTNSGKKDTSKIAYGNFTLSGPLGSPETNSATEEEVVESTDGPPQLNSEVPTLAQSPASEQFTLSGGASITPEESVDKIDDLTKQILLKEIELQKFNLHYSQEVAKQGRWKGWRYAGLQEINAGTGLAGAIISVANRGSYLHRAQGVHRHVQESANYIPMIGSIIGASAAVFEFGVNGYHDVIARRHGFSPTAATKHVEGIKNDIDSLMAQRAALTKVEASSPALSGHVEVDDAEGKVLKDLRDQSLQEFQRFHVGARKLIAFQQWQYFFDFAKYTTNAIGYEFAYLSLHRKHRIWNGRAGALFIVSGQLTMWGPILSRVAAKGVGELTKHRIKRVVQDSNESKVQVLESDLAVLDKLVKQGKVSNLSVATALDREGMYGEHQKVFNDEIRAGQKKNAAAKLTATQNIGAGLYVGGTKTASGILFAIPGFNHHYNDKSVRAGRVTNDLLFTASLIAIPSSAFSMLDTLRIQVRGEINRHKAMKAGMLPGQIASARLKQLDDMEAKLRAK